MSSFRMIDSKRYIRFNYENDYFTATDYYFTQGMNLEVVAPSYSKFPISKALFTPRSSGSQYGISIEHNGYTPTSIESNTILYGDRPFAAALMLKTFALSVDSVRHIRTTSSLTLGVIGPAAGGYEMQKAIHSWIKGQEPFGWQYQIQNDVVVNYEVGLEKNILSSGNNFIVNGFASARVGTLNTKISTGAVVMLGRLNGAIASVFSREKASSGKLKFHLYVQPVVNVVAYDATLQGGLFNSSSPYTISSGDVSHVTFQANYGGVLSFGSIHLDYFKTIISKEFESGMYHRWGGIRVGVNL
ncbi:MAG: lipid A deacylase LpxR family protein [Cyclobacteriaceae bacterium]|nr:lipid A deacylase LpxR family protein [Cyclobacteriaceae bacterium]